MGELRPERLYLNSRLKMVLTKGKTLKKVSKKEVLLENFLLHNPKVGYGVKTLSSINFLIRIFLFRKFVCSGNFPDHEIWKS